MSGDRSRYGRGWLVTVLALLVIAFLVAPQMVLLIQSFTAEDYLSFPPRHFGLRWYHHVFADETWRRAIATSLVVAAVVTPLALVLGTATAFALDSAQPQVRKFLRTALVSPMVLPHVVLGLAFYRVCLPVRLDDSIVTFIIAHLVLCVPYVIVTVGASLQAFDRNLEEAAQSLGASPSQTVFRITLPVIAPGLIAGAVFAFITSFDEFIVTYFLATRNVTVPIQIFSSLSYQLDPTIAAVSGLTLLVTVVLTGLLIARGETVGRNGGVP